MQDPYCLRCQPQVMGACLDLLRQAAATLADEANGVSDNPLIFAEDDEALSGGNFHAEPVAFAADMIAIAICEIGSLAERRIAMLVDPALSGLPAFLTPRPGLNSGFMIPQVTAAALVSENKQRAYPASVDSIPTSANQEDHVSMAAHGARRLSPMAENASRSSASSCWPPRRAATSTRRLRSSAPLEARARAARAARSPRLEDDRYFHPDIAAASRSCATGAIVEAAGEAPLPARARRDDGERPDWLDVRRGDAPLIVSIPHAGDEISATIEPRFVSPGSRARTPTGGSTSSTISPARSARRSCARRSRARSST